MTIAVRIDPANQMVDPGRDAVYTVHIANRTDVVDRVVLSVLGSAGHWSRAEPPALALFPGTGATATVVVKPPVGTPLGATPLGVRAVSATSGLVDVGEANLRVGENRMVDAELRPSDGVRQAPAAEPESTAQRVVCACELGRLDEVGDSTTPEVVEGLQGLAPVGGQVPSHVVHDKAAGCSSPVARRPGSRPLGDAGRHGRPEGGRAGQPARPWCRDR